SSFLLLQYPPPCSSLYPYTTLFRSKEKPAFLIRNAGFEWTGHRPESVPPGTVLEGHFQAKVGGERLAGAGAVREPGGDVFFVERSEEHTSELQSRENLVCRLLLVIK